MIYWPCAFDARTSVKAKLRLGPGCSMTKFTCFSSSSLVSSSPGLDELKFVVLVLVDKLTF